MKISELDEFEKAHPEYERTYETLNIVSGIEGRLKPSEDFRSILKQMKKNNPGSNINTWG